MSHFNPGLISTYNSLTDKHLAGYFSNTRIRRHLQRAGLITRSGRIVPDKEYRHKLIQRAHQRHVRECLAQAIFHKVLEMERLHQIEIKKKLEEFARRERVHKIKVERPKRCEEDIIRILSPHPPVAARSIQKQHSGPEGEHSESSESPSSSRPNTAPGKMQRPVRLKPIHSNSTTASVRRSSPYRHHETSQDSDQPLNRTMNKESRRRFATKEATHGISPYLLPVINNFVTPIPPATKRKERGVKITPNSTYRGRRLLPTTASSSADVTEDPPWLRSSVHQSRVCINMVYFGKTVHLFHDMNYMRDEVKVFQQHCGGENLCVYKGRLREGESFQFISRRHRGFPFSLTFFLNGLQVERLSSCCEFKHRKGSRLGGRLGHFGFSSVEGASPCYKCIIAMGLDKKPTPPPKRVKEDRVREESALGSKISPEMETKRTVGDVVSPSECETGQTLDTETQVKDKTSPEEEKVRDDYEEDFEADDEGPVEEVEAKQEKSPSPSSETERQVPEKDSESEDDEKEDIKSRSGSSFSASDQDESDAEATKDCKDNENQPQQDNREEAAASTDEKDKPNPGETAATEIQSALAKDSDMHNSAGDSTEIEICDTSVPSGAENKQSNSISGDQNDEEPMEESKNEEEHERAKSVQEKLAEAILKESQCSSEPELSDTSTEEEEEPTDKGSKQNSKDENTYSEQQQTLAEEKKCEEIIAVEVAPEQEELSEVETQKDAEQEPHDSSGSTKDEKVSEVEEGEKADETTAEEHKSEKPGESQLPINEENLSQDDKTADPLEEAKSADAEAAENDEDSDEKTAVETKILPDETGQGAKTGEEDESSASEPRNKTDETAVPDNAEVEAMTASETMEIKAESSEEREALSCEEAPETDTERRQEADSEDAAAASQTEVTPENSNSLPEECEATMAEKTAEENIKDETSKDDIKEEEEARKTSGAEASEDDSQQEKYEPGEDRIDKSVEANEKIEKQESEKDAQEEGKQARINSDEMAEDENPQERVTNETEQEGDNKNNMNESADEKQNVAEGTENEPNTEEEEKEKEEAEKGLNEGDTFANKERVEEPEKMEEDEDKEKSETKVAEEEKDDGAEMLAKGEDEDKDAEAENNEECQEKKDVTEKTTGENEGTSEITEKHEEEEVDDMSRCLDNIVESEDAGGGEPTEEAINETEAETIRRSSEKGEIDAENGEISAGAERKPNKDEEEAAAKEKTDLKTTEEETKTEELSKGESPEVKDVTVESGNTDEDRVGTVEKDITEGNDGVVKYDESAKNSPEPELSGLESKEDKLNVRIVSEEREQDENKSDLEQKNGESDSIENNNDMKSNSAVAPSEDQEESSAPTSFDAGCSASQLYQEKCESHTETQAHTGDLSAADGENGVDTEEASKASEEGASVLLKPQAQNEADDETQKVPAGEETPEAFAKEDNTDMVTNWINMHQTSKFFETFVEPLEDLEDEVSNTQISNSNNEETELQRSQSPVKMVFGDEEEMHELKDEKESRDRTQTEAAESDLNSMLAADDHDGNEPQAGGLEEKTEVKCFILNEETDHADVEPEKEAEKPQETRENLESFEEDKAQDEPTQGTAEKNPFSKTEVESSSGSLKPDGILENATSSGMNMDVNQTATDLSFEAEEGNESKSPDGMKDEAEAQDDADKKSQQVTQTNDFTAPKSDDGSQEESHAEEIQPKASEETLSGERRDVQLIQDIKHALGKDRLSTFSVDEKLFGHSSYPLLTAARTESGH